MTPNELADDIRDLGIELANTFNVLNILIGDFRKLEELARSVALNADQHWLELPLVYRPIVVTGEYGVTYTIGGKTWQHEGIDFAVPVGMTVHSCADGKVVYVGFRDGYGNCVRIEHDHEGEKWYTWYAHLTTATVMQWSRIKAGDTIGLTGNTGNTTGPHLHLTVQRATSTYLGAGWAESLRGSINPRDWLRGLPPAAGVVSSIARGGWYAPR